MRKKLRFLFLWGAAIAAALSSCSSQEEVEYPITRSAVGTGFNSNEIEYLTIHYNGKVYSEVPTTYDEMGDFIFLDTEWAAVYNQNLATNPTLSIKLISENEIAMYASLEENLQVNDVKVIETSDAFIPVFSFSTYASVYDLAILTLYDDKNWTDTTLERTLTESKMSVEERRLKDYGFNDKCSSLRLTNNLPNSTTQYIQLGSYKYACSNVEAVFVGFEDKDYTGKSYVAVAGAGERKEIASIPGFNDKLSSFKFLFSQKGQYTPGLH